MSVSLIASVKQLQAIHHLRVSMSLAGLRFSLKKASKRIAPIKSRTSESEQKDYPTTPPHIQPSSSIVIKWLGLTGPCSMFYLVNV
jgi:hypothetical protein